MLTGYVITQPRDTVVLGLFYLEEMMPYKTEWVEPAVFLKHKDVTVYHTYKNDDYDDWVYMKLYTTDKCAREGDGTSFDVRDIYKDLFQRKDAMLTQRWGELDVETDDGRQNIIKAAIDLEIITKGPNDDEGEETEE